MEKYITSFALNIGEINGLFGSNDKKKLAAVKKARTLFDYNDMTGVTSALSVFDAVEDLLFAKMHDAPDAVYCCALLLMCDVFRIALPHEQRIQFGEYIDLINKYLTEDFAMPKTFRLEKLIFNSDCRGVFQKPLVIPPTFARLTNDNDCSYMNLPMIAVWPYTRVKDIQQIFARVVITEKDIKAVQKGKLLDDKLKGAVYRTIMDFIDNINYCAARDLGMLYMSY